MCVHVCMSGDKHESIHVTLHVYRHMNLYGWIDLGRHVCMYAWVDIGRFHECMYVHTHIYCEGAGYCYVDSSSPQVMINNHNDPMLLLLDNSDLPSIVEQ